MNIAIDCTIIGDEITGTGFYIINLINGLAKVSNVDENQNKRIKYFLFGSEKHLKKFLKINKENFTVINKNFKNRILRVLWQYLFFPFELKKYKIDILHSPNYITPLYKLKFKVVLTIHDLTFLIFPDKYPIVKRFLFGKMIKLYAKKADVIIAVSENTKKDILKYLKVKEDKIFVTYESYPEYYNEFIDLTETLCVLKKYGINKRYILFVGMLEPRKNITVLLKAFLKLDKEIDADLVIVGKKGWYFIEIQEFLDSISLTKLKNNIIFTGYVKEDDLKYFYRGAFLFVYPSIYEGFGLPPLQAMACGVPVITSDISSIPEVVGEAAIKIDPNNYLELAEKIKEVFFNQKLRENLIKEGIQRAKKFSMEKIGENALRLYRSI